MKNGIVLLLIGVLLCSCRTTVRIGTDVDEATISIDGEVVGEGQIEVERAQYGRRSERMDVVFRADGYRSRQESIQRERYDFARAVPLAVFWAGYFGYSVYEAGNIYRTGEEGAETAAIIILALGSVFGIYNGLDALAGSYMYDNSYYFILEEN